MRGGGGYSEWSDLITCDPDTLHHLGVGSSTEGGSESRGVESVSSTSWNNWVNPLKVGYTGDTVTYPSVVVNPFNPRGRCESTHYSTRG